MAPNQQVAANVAAFQAAGWTLARETENGRPIVFRRQTTPDGQLLTEERVYVDEHMTLQRWEEARSGERVLYTGRLTPLTPS
jgi:hypothetical protein